MFPNWTGLILLKSSLFGASSSAKVLSSKTEVDIGVDNLLGSLRSLRDGWSCGWDLYWFNSPIDIGEFLLGGSMGGVIWNGLW